MSENKNGVTSSRFSIQISAVFGILLAVFFGGCSSFFSILIFKDRIQDLAGLVALIMTGGAFIGVMGLFVSARLGFVQRKRSSLISTDYKEQVLAFSQRTAKALSWSYGVFLVLVMLPVTYFDIRVLIDIFDNDGISASEKGYLLLIGVCIVLVIWVFFAVGFRFVRKMKNYSDS